MRRVKVPNRERTTGRELRVAEFMRKELTELIRTKMRDPRIDPLNVSLNEVRVSKDFSYADVYLTSSDCETREAQQTLIRVFEKASGFLRSAVASRHSMRTTPQLRFHYDETIERGSRMEALIDEVMSREVVDAE